MWCVLCINEQQKQIYMRSVKNCKCIVRERGEEREEGRRERRGEERGEEKREERRGEEGGGMGEWERTGYNSLRKVIRITRSGNTIIVLHPNRSFGCAQLQQHFLKSIPFIRIRHCNL
jgi:hypothetical protein